jgi:UDP-N-acetylglucosamine 1-carboxyvinyltransferase
VTDTIYSARLKHIDELRRMNGNIKIEGSSAIVSGPVTLQGARVKASDLRAGAALVVAGLLADGVTEITGLDHLDRGYEDITGKLTDLGAKIWREEMSDQEIVQYQNS